MTGMWLCRFFDNLLFDSCPGELPSQCHHVESQWRTDKPQTAMVGEWISCQWFEFVICIQPLLYQASHWEQIVYNGSKVLKIRFSLCNPIHLALSQKLGSKPWDSRVSCYLVIWLCERFDFLDIWGHVIFGMFDIMDTLAVCIQFLTN